MSNWVFLNKHRIRTGLYASTEADGFNGVFSFDTGGYKVRCIASDGMGWKHVSVTLEGSRFTPRWEVMANVKNLFWEDDEAVMQLHPPRKDYVNHHPGCLHLWSPTDPKVSIPLPDSILVGPKSDPVQTGSAVVGAIIGHLFNVSETVTDKDSQ